MNRTIAASLVFAASTIACTTDSEQAAPAESSSSQSIEWSWPPHAAGGLGIKPWHGGLPIADGDIWNPATGFVSHFVEPGLIWSSGASASFGPAGFGMMLAAVERLAISGSTVTWIRPDGERIDFQDNGAGGYTAPVETTAILSHPAWNQFQLRMGGGTYMTFTAPNGGAWLLTSIIDRNANAMTLQYDAADRLVRIIDPLGLTEQYNYGPDGLLASVVDPDNKTWSLTYNWRAELVAIRQPNGGTQTIDYDPWGLHLLVQHRSAMGVSLGHFDFYADRSLRSFADETGAASIITYYANHARVADSYQQITTIYFTTNGEIRQLVDHTGISYFRNVYDSLHRLIVSTDWLGRSVVLAYNTTHDVTYQRDRYGQVNTAVYDGVHNPLSVTGPTYKTSTITYDAYDGVTRIVDGRGRATTFQRDSHGNLLNVIANDGTSLFAATYGSRGEMLTSTDDLGDTASHQYDAYLNLVRTTAPTGIAATASSTPTHRALSATSPAGETYSWLYDAPLRLAQARLPNGGTTSWQYDLDDRIVSVTSSGAGVLFRATGSGDSGGTAAQAVGPSGVTCTWDDKNRLTGESHNGQPVTSCTTPPAPPAPPPAPPVDGTSTDTSTVSTTDTSSNVKAE